MDETTVMDREDLIAAVAESADIAFAEGKINEKQLTRVKRRCERPHLFAGWWKRVESELQAKPEYAACQKADGSFDWEKFFELVIKYLPIILSFFM